MALSISTALSLITLFYLSSAKQNVQVTIHDDNVIATVNESFHGVAFDASLFTTYGLWKFVNITSPKLVTLLKGLSPGYFRVGGTFANWLFFELDDKNKWYNYWAFPKDKTRDSTKKTRGWLFRRPNKLPKETFDTLVNLTKSSNMRLLFDLNAELRTNERKWDPSEAERLFKYCKEKDYGDNLDWELGNEPNHISAHNLTEEEVGEDFVKLNEILKNYPTLNKGSLVGPDVGWMGVSYIKGLAKKAGNFLTAFTIHQYYFNGNISNVSTYLNVSYFVKLQQLFDKVRTELKEAKHEDKSIWLGETSSGYNSGTNDVSDRYVSGFLTLDKLGLSAVNDVKVVIRQTIYNGYYGLLDKITLEPNPDYWLMHVHNSLVGNKVFKVVIEDQTNKTRVYAQCTKIDSKQDVTTYSKGDLTIFALNVGDQEVEFNLNGKYVGKKIDSYIMTPGGNSANSEDMLSKIVKLNGKELKLENNKLPKLEADANPSGIALKPKTFGFFVIRDAGVEACKKMI